MKRVLHIFTVCGRAGTETVLRYLIQGLAAQGIESEVYFERDYGGSAAFEAICPTHFPGARSLDELINSGRFDIVHAISSTPTIGVVEVLARTRFAGAIVIGFHLDYVIGWNRTNADAIVTPLNWWSERLRAYSDLPVITIPNPVDVDRFTPLDPCSRRPGRPVIGWVGRSADKWKNISRLKSVMAALDDRWDYRVADGNLREDPREVFGDLAPRLGWYGRLGYGEMPAFYQELAASRGVLLCTSDWECFGMCILEAMACGCPVVVPSGWGAEELVEHGQSGFIFQREDGIAPILDYLHQLEQPDVWDRMSRAARERVQVDFSVQSVTGRYMEVFRSAATRKRDRSLAGQVKWALRSSGFYSRHLPQGISLCRPRRAVEALDRAVAAHLIHDAVTTRLELAKAFRYHPGVFLKPWRAKFVARIFLNWCTG